MTTSALKEKPAHLAPGTTNPETPEIKDYQPTHHTASKVGEVAARASELPKKQSAFERLLNEEIILDLDKGEQVKIRRVEPRDEQGIYDLYYNMPPDDIYMRFISPFKPKKSADEGLKVSSIKLPDDMVDFVVVTLPPADAPEEWQERVVATAGYMYLRDGGAEACIAVAEDHKRRKPEADEPGLARQLLGHVLVTSLHDDNVKYTVLETESTNSRMHHMLDKLGKETDGIRIEKKYESGTLVFRVYRDKFNRGR